MNLNKLIGDVVETVVMPVVMPVVENNLLPDSLLRYGARSQCAARLADSKMLNVEQQQEQVTRFVQELRQMPIAIQTGSANDQHYEVPAGFFEKVLGPFLKYSCGYWPSPTTSFEESETEMLELYCERAQLRDGMNIVDLGCGWGSVTLFLAQKYPNSKITSISNSNSQREFIVQRAQERGLDNVKVHTGDIAVFDLPEEDKGSFDRIISIEMFEHMKNYGLLMKKLSTWLVPGGKLFVHIFSHRDVPYHFEKGWMTDTFFTGGTMPSDNLLLYFQEDLTIESHWRVDGTHYEKTCNGWLKRMDAVQAEVLPLFEETYGRGNGLKWFVNWRLFFLACAEFFGMEGGQQNIVSHYLFTK